MDLSYESNNNSSISKKNNLSLTLRNSSIKRTLRKNIFRSTKKEKSLIEKSENEESEEDEQERLQRIEQERKDFLIKLLTEDPKDKNKKKRGFKLKPLNQSGFSLDKTLNVKSHIITEPNISRSFPKYLTEKERKKLERKIRKEQERIAKENERKENQKILKEIKDSKTSKDREIFRSNLNRLYGYNNKFLFYNAKLKKGKWDNLEKYQEDILRVSSINLSKDNMLKLFSDLKTIRINSEQAKPLPPINFKALVHHSLDENNEKKKFGLKLQNKKFSQMDEYEKEMYLIKTNSRHEKMNSNNNKFLYKMYEILPEHVVYTIYGKKRKF